MFVDTTVANILMSLSSKIEPSKSEHKSNDKITNLTLESSIRENKVNIKATNEYDSDSNDPSFSIRENKSSYTQEELDVLR